MAGKVLATFFLLVTLLQVRAQFNCYPIKECPSAHANNSEASSARECCIQGLPETGSYSAIDGSTGCRECIVIGFSQEDLTLDEETEQIRIVRVKPLTSASPPVGNSQVEFTIRVHPHSMGTNPMLGSDLKVNDGMQDTITYSETLSQLDEELKLQTLNDTDTGEIEYFELEVTLLQVTPREVDAPLEAFPGPVLKVTIIDDDIIHVEFEVTEYQVNEEQGNLAITFKVNKRIPGATHFIMRPMRYEDYDNEYPELLAKYPNLKPYSLHDEYDQAEEMDFNSTAIPFSILRNETEPDREVIINVFDDDLLEPAEEGFRLVLEVDEDRTRLTEVTFGRQIALCRIDNTDKIRFGFQDDVLALVDVNGTFDRELPLRIISGKTEFPILLSFAIGDRTNATLGVDFTDFTTGNPSVIINSPNTFDPGPSLSVTVKGDDIFEGDELIQVILEYDLDLPPAFRPKHVNDSSDYDSVVDPPPTGSIDIHLKSTLIIIQEGITNNTAHLIVPKMVQEGETFFPNITVLHIVNATFRVYTSSSEGTATRHLDYSFAAEAVSFDPRSTWNDTKLPVVIETDDLVEPNETFTVVFYATSPPGIDKWMKISNPEETVTIIDQNSATIGFEEPTDARKRQSPASPNVMVFEDQSHAILNVVVKGNQRLATNAEVVVRFSTSSGTAESGIDFVAVDRQLRFTGAQQKIPVEIPIINDTMYEQLETFQAQLQFISSNVAATVESAQATVTIKDNDKPIGKDCTLKSSLNLHTFSNQVQSGRDIDISMGCERKLVTSCDPNIDLEIRVDFFQDDFSSTQVAIFYEEQEVFIFENFNLVPSTPPSSDFVFMSASVSIPDIKLTIAMNSTQLTISTEENTLQLAGLCGDLDGELLYPDCMDTFGPGDSMDEFIHSYKVKPSDQVLRGERETCGITTNDTIISDPLMTVPIHVAGFDSSLNLCYEIHGAADKYFNLVSDECTSVNAYYTSAAPDSGLNVIESISVVAVDTAGKCHNITVDASSCMPEVSSDDPTTPVPTTPVPTTSVPTTMAPISQARRRRSTNSILDKNGVSVRSYDSRTRISVPNCEDNELVMWVVCQNQSLFDQDINTTIRGVEMIKFEIVRGLNLKETSHGLLGQFWNIPITVSPYTGAFAYSVENPENYHTVEVHYPMSPVRSFVGFMFDVTWEWKHKHCLYAGDRQGGPAGEVLRDGSVIQGTYEDYVVSDEFGTQFKYGVFKEGVCV